MLAVIGSVALAQHITEPIRESADIDIVGTYEEVEQFIANVRKTEKVVAQYPINGGKTLYVKTNKRIIEASVAWPDSVAEKLYNVLQEEGHSVINMAGMWVRIPSLDMLYLLKMSHRYLKNSPHFLKTMQDIKLMRKHGATIPEHLQEFYEQRMKDTYIYKHPKLDVDKKTFFTDDVPYVYDHDSIHVAVAVMDWPAYTQYMKDGSEVMVDPVKWDALPELRKLHGVLEESYVLALERSQIPFPETDRRKSFDMALMKVCSSITSGWFREFAWENYDKVQALYDENYTTKFWTAVEQGKVKPHNKEM